MTQNEKNGGKGMTRVEIARRAFMAADRKAQEAMRRLRAAEAQEAKREARDGLTEQQKIAKAMALLRKAGYDVTGQLAEAS